MEGNHLLGIFKSPIYRLTWPLSISAGHLCHSQGDVLTRMGIHICQAWECCTMAGSDLWNSTFYSPDGFMNDLSHNRPKHQQVFFQHITLFCFFQELHARFSTVAQSPITRDLPLPKPSTSVITICLQNSSQHKKNLLCCPCFAVRQWKAATRAKTCETRLLYSPESNESQQAARKEYEDSMCLSPLSKIHQNRLPSTCSSVWVGGRAQWLGETQRQYVTSAGVRSVKRGLIINPTKSQD